MDSILEFLNNPIVLGIVTSVYLLLEYWLGKTDTVPQGSTLEVVLSFLKKLLEFFGIGGKKSNMVILPFAFALAAGCGLLDKEPEAPKPPSTPDPNRVCVQVTEANKPQLTAEHGISCKVGDWSYKGAKNCSSSLEKCKSKKD